MSRSKQNKSTRKDSDGKHRKETKEERRIRLQKQEEARQACFKMIPFVVGILVVSMIAFAIYVRSVPPRAPKISQTTTPNLKADFVHDVVREAEHNAQMKKAEKEEAAAAAAGSDSKDNNLAGEQEDVTSESIEL